MFLSILFASTHVFVSGPRSGESNLRAVADLAFCTSLEPIRCRHSIDQVSPARPPVLPLIPIEITPNVIGRSGDEVRITKRSHLRK